jgi:hypothetical protein
MTVVVTTYFMTANECLGPMITGITGNSNITYIIGLAVGMVLSLTLFALFVAFIGIKQKNTIREFDK